jgi:general stress protein CsbA
MEWRGGHAARARASPELGSGRLCTCESRETESRGGTVCIDCSELARCDATILDRSRRHAGYVCSAPLIAAALFAHYQTGYAIAIYIAACAVVSLVAAALMPDYTGQDISTEYDER